MQPSRRPEKLWPRLDTNAWGEEGCAEKSAAVKPSSLCHRNRHDRRDEDTVPDVTVVSEVEATAIYEPSAGPEQPQQGENSAPPEAEGPELRGLSE